jgi:hypothetical protein
VHTIHVCRVKGKPVAEVQRGELYSSTVASQHSESESDEDLAEHPVSHEYEYDEARELILADIAEEITGREGGRVVYDDGEQADVVFAKGQ